MIRATDLLDFFRLPRAEINLMFEKTAENDPFYADVVRGFYKETNLRHPKMLFARRYQHGFALCELPSTFNDYLLKGLQPSARRNYKKAQRLQYEFRRIDYNQNLEGVREIWLSTPVRQGELPRNMREGRVLPISDPPSRTTYHDYPYFGIFRYGKLCAYAGCLIMGELCSLATIFGHADYLEDCVVPMLIIEIAKEVMAAYPNVKYYGYDTYFGGSESLRRFKRKFLFHPHRIKWLLETRSLSPSSAKSLNKNPLMTEQRV